jgi:hypothetical protein
MHSCCAALIKRPRRHLLHISPPQANLVVSECVYMQRPRPPMTVAHRQVWLFRRAGRWVTCTCSCRAFSCKHQLTVGSYPDRQRHSFLWACLPLQVLRLRVAPAPLRIPFRCTDRLQLPTYHLAAINYLSRCTKCPQLPARHSLLSVAPPGALSARSCPLSTSCCQLPHQAHPPGTPSAGSCPLGTSCYQAPRQAQPSTPQLPAHIRKAPRCCSCYP